MKIKIFSTGGTLDKIYFDKKSEYQVGVPQVTEVLDRANVHLNYKVESILRKDSLDLTARDRQLILRHVKSDPTERIVITHGTDTMVLTARVLKKVTGKVIVLTGSMSPAQFRGTDADFNIGSAITAVQCLPHGVYIVLNGRIWNPDKVQKSRKRNRFEER